MKIIRLSPSATESISADGVRILWSYEVPVAVYVPGQGYLKSNRYISHTSRAHADMWPPRHGAVVSMVDHDKILKIVEEK